MMKLTNDFPNSIDEKVKHTSADAHLQLLQFLNEWMNFYDIMRAHQEIAHVPKRASVQSWGMGSAFPDCLCSLLEIFGLPCHPRVSLGRAQPHPESRN